MVGPITLGTPRCLYLTDDRSRYSQGNYYADWLKGFSKAITLDMANNLDAGTNLSQYSHLIFGHSYIDYNLNDGGHVCDRQQETLWMRIRRHMGLAHPYGLARGFHGAKIFLSKNDYKYLPAKRVLLDYIKPDLLVTHTREALGLFNASVKTAWFPFGVESSRCHLTHQPRCIHIGFIGNSHAEFIGNIRVEGVKAIRNKCDGFNLDIRMDEPDRHLLGADYNAWLNSCHLVFNTHSAHGTVGPRFFEAMACGAVPLAPHHEYEGILEADVHYLSVRPDFSDLKDKVKIFFSDTDFRTRLITSCQALAARYDTANMAKEILELVRPSLS